MIGLIAAGFISMSVHHCATFGPGWMADDVCRQCVTTHMQDETPCLAPIIVNDGKP